LTGKCAIEAQSEPEKNSVKVYVGNLPWSVGDSELADLFSPFGAVQSAQVVADRDTGRSRGFGFVEMSDSEARAAIEDLNGREVESRALRVNEAQSKSR
jgi:RNA recognition motif-containing protein